MINDLVLFENKNPLFKDIAYKKIDFLNKDKSWLVVREGNMVNRDLLENKSIDILVSPEKNIKKDSLHYRKSGLDQVACALAKKNDIAIAFSFNEVLNAKNRALIIGKMMQNVRLCRKFKVKMVISTFATNEYETRSYDALMAFGICLSMNPGEAKKALEEAGNVLKRKEKRI